MIHTARGLVYAEPVTDALGLINGVDLAITYDVSVSGRQLAVSALTLLPGATITAADLTEAVANMPVGLGARHRACLPEDDVERDLPPHR